MFKDVTFSCSEAQVLADKAGESLVHTCGSSDPIVLIYGADVYIPPGLGGNDGRREG